MVSTLGKMIALDRNALRRLVWDELGRYSGRGFLTASQALAPRLTRSDLLSSGKVGLRAQLVHRESLELVMDFVLEEAEHSLHVLNAISPAFTSSFSLADIIADRVEAHG
jgi:hypothetical protein